MTPCVHRFGPYQWHLSPEFAPRVAGESPDSGALLKRILERPGSWIQDAARCLRPPAPGRPTLARANLTSLAQGDRLILKQYPPRAPGHALKDWFRVSRAQRAFFTALDLQRCGINCPRAVAAGELRRAGWLCESYYLATEIIDAVPLRELRRHPDRREGKILARLLGTLMGQLHNHGWCHTDPSLSNFLVRRISSGSTVPFELWLVDVESLRRHKISPRLPGDLVQLFSRIPLSSREQAWFVAAYCRERGPAWSSRRFWRSLHPSANPTLRCETHGSLQWTVATGCPLECRPVLADPDTYADQTSHRIKNSRTVTLARVPSALRPGKDLMIRRLNYGQWRHRLRDFFRPSRAQRALRNTDWLRAARIATPRAYAAATRRRAGWPQAAYLVTQEITGSENLAQYVRRSPRLPREVILRLARLLARLHAQNLSHRDLKWTNILLDRAGHPWLIDLDGVKRVPEMTLSLTAKDLARLARYFLADPVRLRWSGMRFVIEYCRVRGSNPKTLAREILTHAAPGD